MNNFIKSAIASTAVVICCTHNEYPAQAYSESCSFIGNMTYCTDSSGGSSTRQRVGNFIYDTYDTNSGTINCTTQYIGNQVFRDCN